MKKLFFDSAITGHHSEYISHIIDYLYLKKEDTDLYYFLVNPYFSEKFPDIYAKAKSIKNLVWHQISPIEFDYINNSVKVSSYLNEFKIMHRHAEKLNIDHVCCLNFNTLRYGTALYKTRYTISGILFLQFYRLKNESFKEKITYYKRYLYSKLGDTNSKITNIFILNDEKTVAFMNKEFKTDVYKMLPDPIPNLMPLENFDIYTHYNIPPKRTIFLHIGSLGDRKGTFEVIDAAKHIDSDHQDLITILLVGKAGNEVERARMKMDIQNVIKDSKVQVIWDDQFVSNAMMKSIFNQCDVVLVPYKNAEFSSGILGHAAASNKMVIATGQGLIKEVVAQNDLGLLIKNPDATSIADAMTTSLQQESPITAQSDFVKNHSPDVFSEIILESCNG